jgi:hypothetical protein
VIFRGFPVCARHFSDFSEKTLVRDQVSWWARTDLCVPVDRVNILRASHPNWFFTPPTHHFVCVRRCLCAHVPKSSGPAPEMFGVARVQMERQTFLWDWPCKKIFSSLKKKNRDHHMTIMMVTPYILLEKWSWVMVMMVTLKIFLAIFTEEMPWLKNYFKHFKKSWPSWWSCDGHA